MTLRAGWILARGQAADSRAHADDSELIPCTLVRSTIEFGLRWKLGANEFTAICLFMGRPAPSWVCGATTRWGDQIIHVVGYRMIPNHPPR
jgi:hypothetical protein